MPASAVLASSRTHHRAPRAVASWLFLCCALVFAMVVVGGVTRLTGSGLSIVEWQPIVGAIPPLTDADWQTAFEKYQQTPQFRLENHAMTVAEFQSIFWWEYIHRLLGRLIGAVFIVPLIWFIARRQVPAGYAWKLCGIFVLGGLQGAMGWYMVKSGLVDDTRVSQFRLTAHLALALAIFAAMFWTGLTLIDPYRTRSTAQQRSARTWAIAFIALVCLMIVTGGFVAGIRAGFAYNTFPLMNGSLVPPEIFMIEPLWRNFFWNMATVQFDHRMIAWVVAFVVPLLWLRVSAVDGLPQRARIGGHLLLAIVAVQIALGIATLLFVVPIPLAALHQAGAVLVFAAGLNVVHALR